MLRNSIHHFQYQYKLYVFNIKRKNKEVNNDIPEIILPVIDR